MDTIKGASTVREKSVALLSFPLLFLSPNRLLVLYNPRFVFRFSFSVLQ